jgi:hypothetical protein
MACPETPLRSSQTLGETSQHRETANFGTFFLVLCSSSVVSDTWHMLCHQVSLLFDINKYVDAKQIVVSCHFSSVALRN